MRLIGQLENRILAERAGVLLGAHGIQVRVEPDDSRHWTVWVLGEEDLDQARQLFKAFLASPEDPRFRVAPVAMPAAEEVPEPRDRKGDSPQVDVGAGVATVVLVLMCGWLAATTRLGADASVVSSFLISETSLPRELHWGSILPEVRQGQVWRLISPVLLHFSWPHLLFNLWTFWGLANSIERRRGTLPLLGMVLGFGLLSNIGQYLQAGPHFGGMSGVIYGLLGYVWMMGRYRPSAGLALQPQIVLMMLVWFVICLSGTPGSPVSRTLGASVANTAHGVGLLAGVVWGRWAASRKT